VVVSAGPVVASVVGLVRYPLKGAAGVAVARSRVDAIGLVGDRRWLLVDDDGRFVTQRQHPRLATLVVDTVFADGDGDVEVGLRLPWGVAHVPPSSPGRRLAVTVWKDRVDAFLADDEHHRALSRWLGASVRLVHLGLPGGRRVDPAWCADDAPGSADDPVVPVGFADGFGVLVASAASARAVALAAGVDVPLDRWRANVIVDGAPPWAEDGWSVVDVGAPGGPAARLALVKPCARCVVTTIDQRRGERGGDEPLSTLGRLRRSTDPRVGGALFGVNAVVDRAATIAVGDDVTVVAARTPWPVAPASPG
jgi:uncharacterized protein YcbX